MNLSVDEYNSIHR